MAQKAIRNVGAIHNNTMSLFEAKAHFCEVIRRAEHGESTTILKHNIPVAFVTPIVQVKKPQYTKREAIDSMLAMRKGNSLGGITIKELIEEGRKY